MSTHLTPFTLPQTAIQALHSTVSTPAPPFPFTALVVTKRRQRLQAWLQGLARNAGAPMPRIRAWTTALSCPVLAPGLTALASIQRPCLAKAARTAVPSWQNNGHRAWMRDTCHHSAHFQRIIYLHTASRPSCFFKVPRQTIPCLARPWDCSTTSLIRVVEQSHDVVICDHAQVSLKTTGLPKWTGSDAGCWLVSRSRFALIEWVRISADSTAQTTVLSLVCSRTVGAECHTSHSTLSHMP